MVEINKDFVQVNPRSMKAEINADDNAVYFASKGKIIKYPMPKFGTIEVSFNDFKPGRPAYKILAD